MHDYAACVSKELDLLVGERTFSYLYAFSNSESFALAMSKMRWKM